jgi:DNA-binding transcriptional LysR family regulator
MLEVRRLMLLRELSIRGTIAAVAEALNYSPSAVSQQLTLLQSEAGVELTRRAGRRLQLTPEAEVLVEAAGEILDVLERAETSIRGGSDEVRGSIRVAVFQSAVLALMPRALRTMAERYPGVRVEMVQHEPEQALHDTWAREFDLVIAEQYPQHSVPWLRGLDRHDLATDPIHLAVSPALEHVRSLADARDLPWTMEPRGAASRHFAEQLCRVAGFEPDVRYETADLQAQIRLIESGNAVALIPDLLWAGGPPPCRLLELPGQPKRTIFTAQRAAAHDSGALRAFRTALEEARTLVAD